MDTDIKLQNLHLHCRTCLNRLIDRKYNLIELPSSILEILNQCQNGLNISQTEFLPQSICIECYERLENFDNFQILSKKSEKFLEKLLKQEKPNSEELNVLEHNEIQLPKFEEQNIFDETENEFETVLVKIELREPGPQLNLENEKQDNDTNDLPESALEVEALDFDFKSDEENSNSAITTKTHKGTKQQSRKLYDCEKCNSSFSKKSQLKSHTTESHTSENAEIPCKYGCGKKFRRNHNAEIHYRTKHKESENESILEQQHEEVEIENLNKIKKSEEIASNENFPILTKTTCPICFQSFSNKSGLRSHQTTHAATRPFQCDQCDRGFNLKARLKRHIKEIHTDTPLQLPCKFECGKIFSRYESLMNHYRIKHISPEKANKPKLKLYICEDCGRAFKTMYNLKEHSYIHRPKEDRPYQCEQCKARFVGKRHYEIHLLRHAGIKNFECEICGLRTTTKKEISQHMNHHTKEKQVTCPLCSKVYTNPENLRRHTMIVHQGIKKYKCRFCDNMFGKPDHLKHHEMRHTGEKPHKCEVCDRAFIQLVALKAHMKTHNKIPKLLESSSA